MATITSPRSDAVQGITSPSLSAAGTPTSSVRPSLEAPRTSNAALSPSLQPQNAPPGAATAQRRNRAALRDYYNLKSKASSATSGPEGRDISRTASITSVASDSTITSSTAVLPDSEPSAALAAQLDDPSFDADAYVAELLKTASLRDILRTESSLVSEIRTLDGERKALVYDNYSKLIKAVGTIAEMQKGMHKQAGGEQQRLASVLGRQRANSLQQQSSPGLDGVKEVGQRLDELLKVVKELSPTAAQGGGTTKQQADAELSARRRRKQQETVKWVLEAPARLQKLIDGGQREDAERLHTSVVEMLRKWKGVDGAEQLYRRCAQIMDSGKEDEDDDDGDDDEQPDHDDTD